MSAVLLGSVWKRIVATGFCFAVSAVGFVITWVECTRHADASDAECLQYALGNPYVLLSVLLVIILGVMAVHRTGLSARSVLLWWAMLFAVFLAWFFVS